MTIAANGIATLSAGDWAAVRDAAGGPPAVRLGDADLLTMTVVLDRRPATRGAVARALAGRTPVALARLCWGHVAGGDGRVRVAMAHRDRVAAVLATLAAHDVAAGPVLAGDIVLVVDEAATGASAERPSLWWGLAAIPLLTGIGGWMLAEATGARVARLQPIAAARMADRGARAATAAVFVRPAIGEYLARLDVAMPPSATLHAIAMGADGALDVEIDTSDPVMLRTALAPDPVLARMGTVAQAPVADRGIRIALRIDR